MKVLKGTVSMVLRALPATQASAHCDIPCGIYDPIAAKIAAQTVLKMVMRIQALKTPASTDSPDVWTAYENTSSRYVGVKEEHAQLCKKELSILWSDYFKPEHLQKYPDLHDTFWKAEKLCSTNKQQVNPQAAKDLVAAVDKVAEIFWGTKGVSWKDTVAEVRFGT
ncbi:MAG: superoxide dismutase, Ni [Chloroflexi bacterium]|nr:superoxide dismutase, Ni [Chloroflexota bacterium]